LSPLEIEEKIKDPDKIILYQHRLQTQKEPTDILPFAKQPFNKWRTDANQYAFGSTTFMKGSVVDSPLTLYIGFMRCEEATGVMWFYYDGPQYLLNEDKDYYIGNADLPYDPNNQIGFGSTKTYHLHFNPVRKTLSVYTEKFNVE
ncbi:ATP-dependent Zn protease domain protein, partial [Candidatus Phytoplasma oryzae]